MKRKIRALAAIKTHPRKKRLRQNSRAEGARARSDEGARAARSFSRLERVAGWEGGGVWAWLEWRKRHTARAGLRRGAGGGG